MAWEQFGHGQESCCGRLGFKSISHGVIKHWPLHWMEIELANSWAPTLDIILDPAGLSWPTRASALMCFIY